MKTLLELKIISATVDGERLGEKISLAVRINADGYVKYSLWHDWDTNGCPLCETNLRLDDNLPTGPTEGESIESFNKRVINLLQANKWIVDHVVKPFRKTKDELKRYKYNMYNKKVETDIPEKAFGFYIDVQAQEVVDDIIKNFPDTTNIGWDSIVEDIHNGGQRDGVSFAYAQMVKDRAVELLENYEYEAAE